MSETEKNVVAKDAVNTENEIPDDEEKAVSEDAGKELSESEEENVDEGNMSLVKHLEELRYRIIRSLLAVLLGSVVSYYFIGDI
ncbi:MAG: twin-arginine translocase subunit TatC, partial [Selenomonadaceae bacterium]|nr:twin-arginine translocase subunit TatC [Selenomonadaceae bacterium]